MDKQSNCTRSDSKKCRTRILWLVFDEKMFVSNRFSRLLVLYGLVIAMAFIVNPFLFFYYEEKQEETNMPSVSRRKLC